MSDDETVVCDAKPASPPFVFGSGAAPTASPFSFGAATSPASPAFSFSAPPPTRPLTAPVLRLNRSAAPVVPPVPAEDEVDATPIGLATLPRDILAMILSFFRTSHIKTVRGLLLDTTIKHAERYPRYGFFVEAKSELATVLALATCNRATHAAGLSDAVWKAHCRSIEVQLPPAEFTVWNAYTRSIEFQISWADHQATRWRENMRPFPEAYVDPRQLDPGAYAFQSEFERYRTLRTYYDRVCDRFEAMVDPATWSDAERRHLEELSSYCAEQVRQKADHSRQYWRRAITEEEEWAALDTCTPEEVAHACIYGFAIRAFQRCGMALGAYKLIDRGLVAFHCYTNDVRNFNCYTEPFLAELTGNAKFDDSRSSSVTIE